MPPGFCLLPKVADEFLAKVKDGTFDGARLSGMTSAERNAAFAEIVGESNASAVNALFESKLLLANQKAGITTWVDQVAGLKPEIRRDMLARVERMDRVLEPKDLDSFLADLAAQKLGFGVTMEEAGRISELAKITADAKAAMASGGDRLAYGEAKVAFSRYVSDLRNAVKTPVTASDLLNNTAGLAKSVKATGDNSALFRQGWKTLFSQPKIWAKNAVQSWVDLAQSMGGKEVLDAVDADVLSRPNALNGRYEKAKLALGNIEEAFPSSLPEKIPGIGRLFKASEAAYTGFLRRTRADVFDTYMEIAERSGETIDRTQLESVGRLVNSMTGRAHLGRAEGAADIANVAFFSLRNLKANAEFLVAHRDPTTGFVTSKETPFVQKQAAINLLKVAAGTATILAIADQVAPGSVEWDPRSSDFGKIKVKETRFDVTGGMGSILVLGARLASGVKKNAGTGKLVELDGSTFGQTRWDALIQFFENKLSPVAAVAKGRMEGRTFEGEKPTLWSDFKDLFIPLPGTAIAENAQHYGESDVLLTAIAAVLDFHGIGSQTFTNKK